MKTATDRSSAALAIFVGSRARATLSAAAGTCPDTKEHEGDCDSDHECYDSLVCGFNNCIYEWNFVDCCREGHLYSK